jgi:hypothetical protein
MTDRYELDSVADLKDLTEARIDSLSIDGINTSIALRLTKKHATIEVSDAEARHLGMIQLLRDTVKPRRRMGIMTPFLRPEYFAFVFAITAVVLLIAVGVAKVPAGEGIGLWVFIAPPMPFLQSSR